MTDNFYSSSKKHDLYRIPLIEPHELVSSGGIGYDWFYKVQYKVSTATDIKEIAVDEVCVNDSLIVLFTSSVYIDYKMNKAWFIIDADKKEMYAFTTLKSYKEHLTLIGIDELPLHQPDDIFLEFANKGYLHWINTLE
jgi:hypothetical protein